jgi:hypothetical protein
MTTPPKPARTTTGDASGFSGQLIREVDLGHILTPCEAAVLGLRLQPLLGGLAGLFLLPRTRSAAGIIHSEGLEFFACIGAQ